MNLSVYRSFLARHAAGRLLTIASSAFLSLLPATTRAEQWTLTFAVTEAKHVDPREGGEPARTEHRSYEESVMLAENHLLVRDDQRETLYDFSLRRVLNLRLADRTYTDISLYSLVDFMAAELANRHALGAATRAAGVASRMFHPFDSETELRMVSPSVPPDAPSFTIERIVRDDELGFEVDGRTVVQFVPSSQTLPPSLQHRLVNYLALGCNIHPEIRHAISTSGAIPQLLVITWRSVGAETTKTLRLTAATSSPSASPPAFVDATPAPLGDRPPWIELAGIFASQQQGEPPTRAAAVAFAADAIRQKQPLDALLALLEYQLQSGESLSDQIRRHREHFNSNAACRQYLKAFDQSSKAACEKSLGLNAGIERTGLARAHMLELQRANHLDRLGRHEEAIGRYLVVLRANPFHAGALHDLGMLFARGFEQTRAWACWDAARRLYPEHPLFSDVAGRERQLASTYPDFF